MQSLINGLPSGSSMTLILVGSSPKVLAASENDKNALRGALAKAAPTQGSADWQAAFAVAAGAAHGSQSSTTVIVSDGGLPESGLPALPGEVRYVPVGSTDNNVAITALGPLHVIVTGVTVPRKGSAQPGAQTSDTMRKLVRYLRKRCPSRDGAHDVTSGGGAREGSPKLHA